MKRFLACLATLACALAASSAALADPASPAAQAPPVGAAPADAKPPATAAKPDDPISDVINAVLSGGLPGTADYYLKATLYHAGARGIRALDSLGCKVVAMRTAAVEGIKVPRHTVLFIKETVGLPMPDGSKHDGYWYASDVGGAIHQGRIDLFTGRSASSMGPLMHLNLSKLTVEPVGVFAGCPTA
jgi:3D (Asp-Asp-Asp) domain-containing protein